MNNKGLLIVLSGPSGAGKGTVLSALSKQKKFFRSISATTRAPRQETERSRAELDGVDYYFLSRAEFERMIESGGLLEHVEYCGNYYGVPIAPLKERLAAGETVILEIEVEGARAVREKFPEAILIFLSPPSIEELHRRLLKRNTNVEDDIKRRLLRAEEELRFAKAYDYIVKNEDAEQAAAEIAAIIEKQIQIQSRKDDIL